ncbi:phosphatidylinositol-glycan biosynthesis class X protein [Aethina tumida]|uniref:phosphatidylinositol-glycan biosynthesis class X protein n=1 Tax=Aethina tumida TaxID=116153 RepID=UPI00096B547A|nr:phosphatidylinositol-glycan biosynthesis class X protein [Aethina tumida]
MYTITRLICLLIFKTAFIKADTECFQPNTYITQKISNEGFHREINWLIEISEPPVEEWVKSSCNVALRLDVPNGMYVNPDEAFNLNETEYFSIRVIGKVDVEVPSHEGKEHKVMIYLNNSFINRVQINLPIHLRYQRSQITGGYGKVYLQKPSLLVWCPDSLNKICQKGLKVDAPCYHFGSKRCVWKNITYDALFEDADLFVPIGDLDHYPIVSIVTLLLGCAGSIYVLSILSMTPL